jgi:hypothetical protein
MTKRELIDLLEGMDTPDDVSVLVRCDGSDVWDVSPESATQCTVEQFEKAGGYHYYELPEYCYGELDGYDKTTIPVILLRGV